MLKERIRAWYNWLFLGWQRSPYCHLILIWGWLVRLCWSAWTRLFEWGASKAYFSLTSSWIERYSQIASRSLWRQTHEHLTQFYKLAPKGKNHWLWFGITSWGGWVLLTKEWYSRIQVTRDDPEPTKWFQKRYLELGGHSVPASLWRHAILWVENQSIWIIDPY